jgi:hypothetical protein
VGLTSGLGQVVLVARSAPRGSIDSVGLPVERDSKRAGREIAVTLKVSANTPYRLSVVGNGSKDAFYGGIEVRGLSGVFQPVGRGTSVLVGRGQGEAGTGRLTLLYRVANSASGPIPAPPVRYELAIAPEM